MTNVDAVSGDLSADDSGRPFDSRRRLLVGGLGALAGIGALVTKSSPASAATGQRMVLGETNSASSKTFLDATANSNLIGMQCNVTGSSSLALYGATGGTTGGGIGVQGSDYGTNAPEVGVGVYGTSNEGDGVKAMGGRNGISATGGDSGAGVLAQNSGTGPALQVEGTASFSRSGVVVVPAGAKAVSVTGVTLSASSLVLATAQLQQGSLAVAAAVADLNTSSIEIFLTRAASSALPVAWFVIN